MTSILHGTQPGKGQKGLVVGGLGDGEGEGREKGLADELRS